MWTTTELQRCFEAYKSGGYKAAMQLTGRTQQAIKHAIKKHDWSSSRPLLGQQIIAWAESLGPGAYWTSRQAAEQLGNIAPENVNCALFKLIKKKLLSRRPDRLYPNRYEYTIKGDTDGSE